MPKSMKQSPNVMSKVVIPRGSQSGVAALQPPKPKEKAPSTGGKDKWQVKAVKFAPMEKVADNPTIGRSVDALADVISTLETAISVLKLVGSMLNAFQSDANNLFRALDFAISALLKALDELAVSIASTGIYALPVMPNTSPFTPDVPPGGGFPEFRAKVSHALTNASDPNRPRFYKGDYMGGIVIALTAGTNLGDLLRDLSILARLFGGDKANADLTPPVASLTATPGLFYKTEGTQAGIVDTIGAYLSSAMGVKLPGIQLA